MAMLRWRLREVFMRQTERFRYTIGSTADSGAVRGFVRYGVVVTEIDAEGRSGDSADFFVVFPDTGNQERNEVQAINKARNLALMIANDKPAMPA